MSLLPVGSQLGNHQVDYDYGNKKRKRKKKGRKSKKKRGSKKRKSSKKKKGSKKKRSKKTTEAPVKKTQPKKTESNAQVYIAVNAKVKCENVFEYWENGYRFCEEQDQLLRDQRKVARGKKAPKKQPIIQKGVKCEGMEEYLDVWDKHNLCQCKGNLNCYFMSERMNE